MATGGSQVFDNEDATDWLDEFNSDPVSALTSALSDVAELDAGDYVDATASAYALAAAEFVAAARTEDMGRLPKSAIKTFKDHMDDINDADLAAVARKAVSRVLKHSELKDEHADGEDGQEWIDDVSELLEGLKG
jgi:Domain of unknown function (DUF4259)